MNPKIKESFGSAWDVAHLWANQMQIYARCYRTNVHFHKNEFYSYSTVIGTIVTARNGQRVYVLDMSHISHTTRSHQAFMEDSIPEGEIKFFVEGAKSADYKRVGNKIRPTGYDRGRKAIYSMLLEAIELLDKSYRARTNKLIYLGNARKAIDNARCYIQLFGYDRTQYWYGGYDLRRIGRKSAIWKEFSDYGKMYDIATEFHPYDDPSEYTIRLLKLCVTLVACDVLVKDSVSDKDWAYIQEKYFSLYDKESCKAERMVYNKWLEHKNEVVRRQYERERIEQEKQWAILEEEWRKEDEKRIEQDNAEIEAWHGGATRYLHLTSTKYRHSSAYNTWLRVHNGHIETSKGICLSFQEGERLWKIVRAFEAGHEFRHELALDLNDHHWEFNEYKDHVLHAGCHLIPFFECQRIADQMGWEGCRTLVPMSHYNKAI